MKNFGEKGEWAYPGTSKFFGYPLLFGMYILRNGESYRCQIWPVHSEGPSEQKPMKNFREKRAWAYPGTAQFFRVPPIISGTGKATDFKFGMYIHRVHPNKSPSKISEKRERGRIQGLPSFLGYLLLSQERGKLQILNLACTFRGSIRIKAHENFWRKGSVGVSRDCQNFLGTPYYLGNGESYRFQIWHVHSEGPSEQKLMKNFTVKGTWAYPGTAHFFGYPLLSQERGKLQISNLACTFRGSIRIKAHENFWRKGSVGVCGDYPNFSGTPYYLRNGESYGFHILHAHLWAQSEQKPIKNSGKVAVGVVRDSWKFSGRPYIGRIARSSLW